MFLTSHSTAMSIISIKLEIEKIRGGGDGCLWYGNSYTYTVAPFRIVFKCNTPVKSILSSKRSTSTPILTPDERSVSIAYLPNFFKLYILSTV